MALEIYFRADVAEQIVSTAVGMLSAAAAHGLSNREYVRGILDFARAEALGYRIPWPWMEGELRTALTDRGHEELLDMLAAKASVVQMLAQ